jgi:hypothetical protein
MKPKTDDRADYEVPDPKELASCIEFQVESRASDPNLGGVIEVRAEPDRIGVRWEGEKVWTWLQWADLMVLGENWPETVKSMIQEKYDQAYEDGLKEAIEVAAKSPADLEAEHRRYIESHKIRIVSRTIQPLKIKMPDGAVYSSQTMEP